MLITAQLGVDIPGALIATVEYMKQIKYDNVEDPIEISDALLQAIEQAAKNAKLELSGKGVFPLPGFAYAKASSQHLTGRSRHCNQASTLNSLIFAPFHTAFTRSSSIGVW